MGLVSKQNERGLARADVSISIDSSMVICSFSAFLPLFALGDAPLSALRFVPVAAGDDCDAEAGLDCCDCCDDESLADRRAMMRGLRD